MHKSHEHHHQIGSAQLNTMIISPALKQKIMHLPLESIALNSSELFIVQKTDRLQTLNRG